MAIQTLPEYAQMLFEGYSEQIDPPMSRTEFEDGYIRQDAKITRRRIVRNATLKICSLEDLQAFKCWLRDDLGNGAWWFLMYDYVEQRQLRCRFVDGAFLFKPVNQVQPTAHNVWTADCTIESWY
jgi:hypothetical protein